ncbi:hypothetical protein [Kitasatospora sp. NPDC050543]|uniref:hypothetical protein n=1 Tax=Kitasatospora sp. NPDC050543 TaxID=3364054 RepID=UPI003794FFED
MEATAALAAILESLPMDPTEREAYAFFISARGRVCDFIRRDGAFTLPLTIQGHDYVATLRAASPP